MVIWGILCAIFLIAEAATPALVSIWLALAAFLTMLFSFFVEDRIIQALLFSVLSLIFILVFKPLCKKYIKKGEKLSAGEVVIVRCTKTGEEGYTYDVRYKGGIWTAISKEKHSDGAMIAIRSFEGNKIRL